jgi:hypothetical protein
VGQWSRRPHLTELNPLFDARSLKNTDQDRELTLTANLFQKNDLIVKDLGKDDP